jgi:hypothetical protein
MSNPCNMINTITDVRRSLRWIADRCDNQSDLKECFSLIVRCYELLRRVESDCLSERNLNTRTCPLLLEKDRK